MPLWLLKVLKGSHVLGGLFCTVDLYSPYLEKRMGTAPWKVSSLLQLQGVGLSSGDQLQGAKG